MGVRYEAVSRRLKRGDVLARPYPDDKPRMRLGVPEGETSCTVSCEGREVPPGHFMEIELRDTAAEEPQSDGVTTCG